MGIFWFSKIGLCSLNLVDCSNGFSLVSCVWWKVFARTYSLFVRGERCLRVLFCYLCVVNEVARAFPLFVRDGWNSAYLFAICLW